MESYKCRLCFKGFVNGRALGGHMGSHMPTLHKFSVDEEEEEKPSELSDETESDVSSSSYEEKRNGLRENDPKFAFTGSDRTVWLVTPVVYEAYRILQLMRGLTLSSEVNTPVWVVHMRRGLVSWWVLILGMQLMRVAWFAGFASKTTTS